LDILNKLPTNAAIQAALASKKLDNSDSLPEMRKLLADYSKTKGDLNFLRAVHVAGSKGKGSVCAFAEQIFRFKGFKTGMFTSPHLVHPRERIRINGAPVTEEIFTKHVLRLDANLKQNGEQVSFFRFLWILAVDIFNEAGVDVGIIEVGMGGRFDATNVLNEPTVCGITSLALEHVNILGPTIKEIAWNKAGIIKPGIPVRSVKQFVHPETEEIIKHEAETVKAPLEFVRNDSWIDDSWILGIEGSHQKENAALACSLTSVWLQKWRPKMQLTNLDLKSALKIAKWPGRQQIHVVSNDLTLFLDGSHTFESVSATADWFTSNSTGNIQNYLFFHSSPDRDHVKLLQPLLNISHLFSKVYFMIPSSLHGNVSKIKEHHIEMSDYWSKMTLSPNSSVIESIPSDLKGSVNLNFLVCGSLYLVGNFMEIYSVDT
jgi:folylpolyglutamate synthase